MSGSDLFVTSLEEGTIGEYTTSGAAVNLALVSGLNSPYFVAVSGADLFVTNFYSDTIGEYTTSGATVNPALVSGLSDPAGIIVTPEPGSLALCASRFSPGARWLVGHAWRRRRRRGLGIAAESR